MLWRREREREITALFTFNTSDIDVRGHGGQICVEEKRRRRPWRREKEDGENGIGEDMAERKAERGGAPTTPKPPKAFEGKRRNRIIMMMIDSVLGIV